MAETLADKIEKRIRGLPCRHSHYIAPMKETLGDVLDRNLIRWIALESAAVATHGNMEQEPALFVGNVSVAIQKMQHENRSLRAELADAIKKIDNLQRELDLIQMPYQA